jgi:hypothetical protein
MFYINTENIAGTTEWDLLAAGYEQMPTSPRLLRIIKRGAIWAKDGKIYLVQLY